MTASNKIALTNVRVFDGACMREPSTVVIDGNVIGEDASGATKVDGHGAFLLPGLIDAHIHLNGVKSLEELRRHGVTTGLDMACWPPARVDALRGLKGHTDIRSAGIPATAPGTTHSRIPGFSKEAMLSTAKHAAKFVADRVAEGSDYIKVIADTPGPDQATLNAVVVAAHEHNKLVIAHASAFEPFRMAQEAKVDIVTHVPLDKPLDSDDVTRMTAEDRVVVPTLTMMEGIINRLHPKGRDYAHGRASVAALYHAGVPILAGTDANTTPGVPASVAHGESLHHELELLVDAGLSNLDALRAATSLPAKHFGLSDRGVIETGRRADLILIGANPLDDIRATRQILRVWCGGMEMLQPTHEDPLPSSALKEFSAPPDRSHGSAAITASNGEHPSTGHTQHSTVPAARKSEPVLKSHSNGVEEPSALKENHSHAPETSAALKVVLPSDDASQDSGNSTSPRLAPTLDGTTHPKIPAASEALSTSSSPTYDLNAKTPLEAVPSSNSTSHDLQTSTSPETALTLGRVTQELEVSHAPAADHILNGTSYEPKTAPASEALSTSNGATHVLEDPNTLETQFDSAEVSHRSKTPHEPVAGATVDGATHDLEASNVPKAVFTSNDASHDSEGSIAPKLGPTTSYASQALHTSSKPEAIRTFDDATMASVSTTSPGHRGLGEVAN